MKARRAILASLAIALPLVEGADMKDVAGSEPPGRLVVNGDGTVTDTVTSLHWQQVSAAQYQASVSCASLSLGMYTSGWRLPTVKELVSLVDYESATAPMIDTAAFPGTASGDYWTSETPNGTIQSAYSVNFGNGRVDPPQGCCGSPNVRCVHD